MLHIHRMQRYCGAALEAHYECICVLGCNRWWRDLLQKKKKKAIPTLPHKVCKLCCSYTIINEQVLCGYNGVIEVAFEAGKTTCIGSSTTARQCSHATISGSKAEN